MLELKVAAVQSFALLINNFREATPARPGHAPALTLAPHTSTRPGCQTEAFL